MKRTTSPPKKDFAHEHRGSGASFLLTPGLDVTLILYFPLDLDFWVYIHMNMVLACMFPASNVPFESFLFQKTFLPFERRVLDLYPQARPRKGFGRIWGGSS